LTWADDAWRFAASHATVVGEAENHDATDVYVGEAFIDKASRLRRDLSEQHIAD
jgi:hypothetical protein